MTENQHATNGVASDDQMNDEKYECTDTTLTTTNIFKEESDLINRIRDILHLDEEIQQSNDDHLPPKKHERKLSINGITLTAATLEFKIERAKQKFGAGSMEEAFYECWKIPPEQRTLEIWKLGAECSKKLRCFAVAEKWFSEAINACRSHNTNLNIKLEQARIARFYSIYLTRYPMIDIRVDERGKGIYAKRVISTGEDIFTDIPIVHSQTVDTLTISPACATCTTSLLTPSLYFETSWLQMSDKLHKQIEDNWPKITIIPCTGCHYEIYCSEECRLKAWNSCHRILCPSNNSAAVELYQFCANRQTIVRETWNSIFSPMIIAKLWAMIIIDTADHLTNDNTLSSSIPNGIETSTAIERTKEKFSEFISTGDETYIHTIPRMLRIMQNIFDHSSLPFHYEIDEKEFSYRFYQIACNAQSFSSPTYAATIYSHFLFNIRNDRNFCHILQKYLHGEPRDQVFGGLFLLQSSLNHSCDNSVEIMDCQVTPEQAGVKVRCKHQLKPGDELTINYVDLALSRRARRAMLKRAYNFWCECIRCRFEGDDCNSCTECRKYSENDRKSFPACSRCRAAWYCSADCQKRAWKHGHKIICRDWTKERSSSSTN
ncbi:unnamed protein product [Didymodactylos carnosus]|uniref:MYND-type domain-containing protein n=1 Tax=Didymodactylos carnosus TaxID=1234261 RepID=A0A813Q6X4_9BILA|nr:unnamed protein product [Didymodactylos carnosus]CAF0762837.1 unnamed protein product [Didymodactylos carnosus]CAF3511758.1 unnamed protein product [Didymodactylos carnosus]CAF3543933.1 unnamed protein product [Didymodactylos carnosus]